MVIIRVRVSFRVSIRLSAMYGFSFVKYHSNKELFPLGGPGGPDLPKKNKKKMDGTPKFLRSFLMNRV